MIVPSAFPVDITAEVTSKMTTSLRDRLRAGKQDWPRLYYLIRRVVLPLLCIICLALLFGHIIAWIEADGEIAANDATLAFTYRAFQKKKNQTDSLTLSMGDVTGYCYVQYITSMAAGNMNMTGDDEQYSTNSTSGGDDNAFPKQLVDCGTRVANETIPPDDVDAFYRESGIFQDAKYSNGKLTFFWNTCSPPRDEEMFERNYYNYADHIKNEWLESYQTLYDQNIDAGMDQANANEQAINEAEGGTGCTINTAGGAFFWFT